jgi:hypothetical protein
VGLQELSDPLPQGLIAGARLVKVRGLLGRVGPLERFDEEIAFSHGPLPRVGSSLGVVVQCEVRVWFAQRFLLHFFAG